MPGCSSQCIGILLRELDNDHLHVKVRPTWWRKCADPLEKEVLEGFHEELADHANQDGAETLLQQLAESASHALRISARMPVQTRDINQLMSALFAENCALRPWLDIREIQQRLQALVRTKTAWAAAAATACALILPPLQHSISQKHLLFSHSQLPQPALGFLESSYMPSRTLDIPADSIGILANSGSGFITGSKSTAMPRPLVGDSASTEDKFNAALDEGTQGKVDATTSEPDWVASTPFLPFEQLNQLSASAAAPSTASPSGGSNEEGDNTHGSTTPSSSGAASADATSEALALNRLIQSASPEAASGWISPIEIRDQLSSTKASPQLTETPEPQSTVELISGLAALCILLRRKKHYRERL